jgi:hypothetical protein
LPESLRIQASASALLQPRRSRDLLLGASAALLAASVLILAAADFLGLVDLIHSGQPSGFRIASAGSLVFDLILASAFGLSCGAFLSRAERRSRRLEVGATLAALGVSVGLISAVFATATSINHDYPSSYITSGSLVAAARFATVFAALAASRGFSETAGSAPDAVGRESWLGWAAGGLAVSYGLAMFSQVFIAHYLREAGATSSYRTGVDVAIFGYAIALLAGAIAAFGFRGSRRRQHERVAKWLSRRDGVLGLATGVFGLAFLLMGIGVLLEVAAAPDNGFNSTKIAVLWLAVAFALGNAIASACAAFGFSRSVSCREDLRAARFFGGSTQPDAEDSKAEQRQAEQ